MLETKSLGRIPEVIGRVGILAILWSIPNCSSNNGALKLGIGSDVAQPPPPLRLAILATAGRHGRIEPSGQIMASLHDDVVFRISPDEGYIIESVVIDRSYSAGTPGEYTFAHVNTNHTIEVSFISPPVHGGSTH
jgi:hypothetical protein